MAFELSYGGVPFCINTTEVDTLIDWKTPWYDVRLTLPHIPNPLMYLANTVDKFRPKLAPGMLYYPSGLRWGEFHGLATDDQLKKMLPLAFSSGVTPLPLVCKQCKTWTIEKMYMLPPRPIAKFGKATGLWHIPLVDDRYYWQWKNTEAPEFTLSSTWDDVFTWVKTKLGITLTVDTIDSHYSGPEPNSDLNRPFESAAALLEAACYNTGLTLVRNFDGTYKASNTASALAAVTANLAANTAYLAGGQALDLNAVAKAAILPEKVVVAFPMWILDSGYANSWTDHIPQPINTGDYYNHEVNLSDILSGVTGFSGKKYFVETCKATYNTDSDPDPSNKTTIDNMAKQIATDYYKQLAGAAGIDISFPGVADWSPDGLTDLLVYWQEDRLYTRAESRPYNSGVQYLSHQGPDVGDGKTCIPFVEDVCCKDGELHISKKFLRVPPTGGIKVDDTECSSMGSSLCG